MRDRGADQSEDGTGGKPRQLSNVAQVGFARHWRTLSSFAVAFTSGQRETQRSISMPAVAGEPLPRFESESFWHDRKRRQRASQIAMGEAFSGKLAGAEYGDGAPEGAATGAAD